MTPITSYILTPTSGPLVQVDISGTAYAWYQVYADNALVTETTATSFSVVLMPNQKVDVLGLGVGEHGTDFSSSLNDSHGDHVEISFPSSANGLPIRVYYDAGSGIIDYGRPIFDGSVVGSTSIGFGLTAFGTGNGFGLGSSGGSSLVLTHRLESGTYKFAVVNYGPADNFHAPVITTVNVSTRPDEITPAIIAYDPVTDTLTIGV